MSGIIGNNDDNRAARRRRSKMSVSYGSSASPLMEGGDDMKKEGDPLIGTETDLSITGDSHTKASTYSATLGGANIGLSSTIEEEEDESSSPPLRRLALSLSLYINILITISKSIAYAQTLSLSVLAALVDSFLDIASQLVLYYTEKHSSMQRRSSALYPAGASRLEPLGVLTCAALMGMASFEVLKDALSALATRTIDLDSFNMAGFYNMTAIIAVKFGLYILCRKATTTTITSSSSSPADDKKQSNSAVVVSHPDPTLDALAQDHWNDVLSNGVASAALLCVLRNPSLWFLDPVGAILISLYIIHSWYETGREQIEQLTGKVAPQEFLDELYDIAQNFDERMLVDVIRAYHFGPKFLVEIEVVLPKNTLLYESHDLGMELQYEIEGKEEVERCFVHIDYEQRPYDEHVVSKVPELREKIKLEQRKMNMSFSV